MTVIHTQLPPSPSDGPPPATGRPRRRVAVALFVVACLATGLAAPLPYLLSSLDTLAEGGAGLAAHYVDQPRGIQLALYVHASAAGMAMLLTPVQFLGAVRRRFPGLHRWSGRISVVAIVVGAAGGLVIAPFGYAGLSGLVGFSALAVIWAYSALRSVQLARRGDLVAHRRWGLRLVALTFAATTLRLWVGLWTAVGVGALGLEPQEAFDQMYPFTPFLSWIPNLVAVEWYLRRSAQQPAIR